MNQQNYCFQKINYEYKIKRNISNKKQNLKKTNYNDAK